MRFHLNRPTRLGFALLIGLAMSWACADAQAQVQWRTDYEAARQEAINAGKPLVIAFTITTNDRSWSALMEEQTYSDSDVSQVLNQKFVPFMIDGDTAGLVKRFEVGPVPDTVILDPATGQTILRVLGHLGPGEYLEMLQDTKFRVEAFKASPEAVKLLNQAEEAFDENDFQTTLQLTTESIALYNRCPAAYRWRSRALVNLGEYEEALLDINRGLQFVSDDANLFLERGFIYYYLGRFHEAMADFHASRRHMKGSWAYSAMQTWYCRIALAQFDQAQKFLDGYQKNYTYKRYEGHVYGILRAASSPGPPAYMVDRYKKAPYYQFMAHRMVAMRALGEGDYEMAYHHLRQAKAMTQYKNTSEYQAILLDLKSMEADIPKTGTIQLDM